MYFIQFTHHLILNYSLSTISNTNLFKDKLKKPDYIFLFVPK